MNGKLMIISIPCYSRGKTFSIQVYNDIHGICKQRLLGSIVQSGNSNVKCVTLLHRDTGMFAELPFAANGTSSAHLTGTVSLQEIWMAGRNTKGGMLAPPPPFFCGWDLPACSFLILVEKIIRFQIFLLWLFRACNNQQPVFNYEKYQIYKVLCVDEYPQ